MGQRTAKRSGFGCDRYLEDIEVLQRIVAFSGIPLLAEQDLSKDPFCVVVNSSAFRLHASERCIVLSAISSAGVCGNNSVASAFGCSRDGESTTVNLCGLSIVKSQAALRL